MCKGQVLGSKTSWIEGCTSLTEFSGSKEGCKFSFIQASTCSLILVIEYKVINKNWTREKILDLHNLTWSYERKVWNESVNQINKNLIEIWNADAAASSATGDGVCWQRPLGFSVDSSYSCKASNYNTYTIPQAARAHGPLPPHRGGVVFGSRYLVF